MKKSVKKIWLNALRSGEYNQGEGRLRRGSGSEAQYCCLGVLCDLYRKSAVGKKKRAKWNDVGFVPKRQSSSVMPERFYLPKEVIEWAGLTSKNPRTENEKDLAFLNDSMRKNFKEIADEIEMKV